MIKKNFIIIFAVLTGVAFGVFMFGNGKTTFYIKNSAPSLRAASTDQNIYQAEDKIGDLQNTIIPSIKIPENITENFAEFLAKEIISKNDQPKDINSPAEPGLNMPDINKITEKFVTNGLRQANENILNIKQPEIKTSPNNSKEAIELYLTETQKIIKDNLNGEPLLSILEDINKNKGQEVEKLLPIISAHETAANQIEEKTMPSDLKNLMTEEIQLLRITSNILRAVISAETDPLGTIAAIKQFGALLENWVNLQNKSNEFIKKFNQTR